MAYIGNVKDCVNLYQDRLNFQENQITFKADQFLFGNLHFFLYAYIVAMINYSDLGLQ